MSAAIYQGILMAAVSNRPVVQGRARKTDLAGLYHKSQGTSGPATSTRASGPLASSPMARPIQTPSRQYQTGLRAALGRLVMAQVRPVTRKGAVRTAHHNPKHPQPTAQYKEA